MFRTIGLAVLVAAPFAAAAQVDYSFISLPVEMRGVWIDAGAIPRTEDGVRALVRDYAAANINVLLPETVMRGYAGYPSDLLRRDPRFEGAPDVLRVMIDEAHRHGIEVHPWVWVFRAGYTQDRGAILTSHPDWVELDRNGRDLSANGGLWISPCSGEARDFLAALFAELVSRYDVDGLHFDYIRYEVERPIPYGYSPHSRELFAAQYGIDPADIDRLSFHQLEWNSFRERQINTFVQRIALQTRSIKPDVKLSAAVGSDPKTARLNLMQNWVHWADNGWVDFVTPMSYTANHDTFARLVGEQRSAAGNRTLLCPGIGLHLHKDDAGPAVRQIGLAREAAMHGQALFASSYLLGVHLAALRAGPYAERAVLPFRDPWQRSLTLMDRSISLREQGDSAGAGYFCDLATALADYAMYVQCDRPYVRPSRPPLEVPETIVPLPTVKVPGIGSPIVVDGCLDEDAWLSATRVTLDYTAAGDKAPVQTIALLARDSENLYIAFGAEEPLIDRLKAEVTNRDGPTFSDDSVEVFLDPGAAGTEYYHLSTNTLGTLFDQKVFSPSWNAQWSAAAQLENGAWTAEMAVGFAALGVQPPTPGQRWRLNLTRNRTTSGEMDNISWAVPYGGFHTPDRFGWAVFE